MKRQALAAALFALALSSTFADAKPVVKNLGGGLEELAKGTASPKASAARVAGKPALTSPVMLDASGRPLVRITLDGSVRSE